MCLCLSLCECVKHSLQMMITNDVFTFNSKGLVITETKIALNVSESSDWSNDYANLWGSHFNQSTYSRNFGSLSVSFRLNSVNLIYFYWIFGRFKSIRAIIVLLHVNYMYVKGILSIDIYAFGHIYLSVTFSRLYWPKVSEWVRYPMKWSEWRENGAINY